MKRHRLFIVALGFACAGMLLASCNDASDQPVDPTVITAGTIAKATQRPIMDFVSAQGITSYFVPPALDFMGWYMFDDNGVLLASVDYAGVSDRYLSGTLGTTFSGTIVEKSRPDGRADVSVNLHTWNTMMYFLDGQSGNFATDPLLLGNRLGDVANGAAPAIGNAHFEIEFINSCPGAPLPDFMWALYGALIPGYPLLPSGYDPWPGFELVSIRINATADGPLHAAAGFGPYGTPGQGKIVQVNLRSQTQHNGMHGDQWPVELIRISKRP